MRCTTCKKDKNENEFYLEREKPRARCKSCTRRVIRMAHWKKRGISIEWEDFEALYDLQDGKCAICECELNKDGENKAMSAVIDHDHESEVTRGLLCNNCNRAIGLLKEDINVLQKAIYYLDGWKPSHQKKGK